MQIPFFYLGQRFFLNKNVSRDCRLNLCGRKMATLRIKRHLHCISFLIKPINKILKSSTKLLIQGLLLTVHGKTSIDGITNSLTIHFKAMFYIRFVPTTLLYVRKI